MQKYHCFQFVHKSLLNVTQLSNSNIKFKSFTRWMVFDSQTFDVALPMQRFPLLGFDFVISPRPLLSIYGECITMDS